MNTVTIDKGSKVKVEFEGEVEQQDGASGVFIRTKSGTAYYVPSGVAKVTVTEKPLPAEPPMGSIVTDNLGCCIFKRLYPGEWYKLSDNSVVRSAGRKLTWRDVVTQIRDSGGPVNYLVVDTSRNETAGLKKGPWLTKDARNNAPIEVVWDASEFPEGRVKFLNVIRGEIARFRPEQARDLARAIRATVGN